MTHAILTYSADHDARVRPEGLRGEVLPIRVKRYTDADAFPYERYRDPTTGRFNFEGPLWFVSREPSIKLDFHPAWDGLLASERLVNLLRSQKESKITAKEVVAVNEKGEPNAAHPLFFVQVADFLPIAETKQMHLDGPYLQELAGPTAMGTKDGRAVILRALHLPVRTDLPPIVVASDLLPLVHVVDSSLAYAIASADIVGARLIPIADIAVVDFFPNGPTGYTLFGPQWRLRKDLALWTELNGPPERESMVDPTKPTDPVVAALLEQVRAQQNKPLKG